MAWNADIDWDNASINDMLPIFQDLIPAIQERYNALGTTSIGYSLTKTAEELILLRPIEAFYWLVRTIDRIIPYFVDHTQAVGGAFNGFASIPMWSDTSIIQSVFGGDYDPARHFLDYDWTSAPAQPPERYALLPLSQIVKMYYGIVDRLRWTRRDYTHFAIDPTIAFTSPTNGGQKWIEGDGAGNDFLTWADLLAYYPTVPWSSWASSDSIYTYGTFADYGGIYEFLSYQIYPVWTYALNSGTLVHDADVYFTSASPSAEVSIFDAMGTELVEGAMGRLTTFAGKSGTSVSLDFQAFTDATLSPPPDPEVNFFTEYDTGTTTEAYTLGQSVTSITLTFASDPGTFDATGMIVFDAWMGTDQFAYSAVAGTGTSRTFTVSHTFGDNYPLGWAFVDVYSDRSNDAGLTPGNTKKKGFEATAGELVLKFDVAGGFDYVS